MFKGDSVEGSTGEGEQSAESDEKNVEE